MNSLNADTPTLIAVQATISLFLAAFKSPRYNLELFLFGALAHELSSSTYALKLFTGFVAISIPLDLIWIIRTFHRTGIFHFLLILLNMLLKFWTFSLAVGTLRDRGDDTYANVPTVNVGRNGIFLGPPSAQGGNARHPGGPIWSMPGSMPDDLETAAETRAPAMPASGGQRLGGGGAPPPPPAKTPASRPGEGSYQSI